MDSNIREVFVKRVLNRLGEDAESAERVAESQRVGGILGPDVKLDQLLDPSVVSG